MSAIPQNSYNYISTQTGTLVATGTGVLVAIVINKTAAGTIIVADSTTTTTPAIATLKSSVAEGTYYYNCSFANGLYITTGAASDITVIYRQ